MNDNAGAYLGIVLLPWGILSHYGSKNAFQSSKVHDELVSQTKPFKQHVGDVNANCLPNLMWNFICCVTSVPPFLSSSLYSVWRTF